jgi:hypothetical protein
MSKIDHTQQQSMQYRTGKIALSMKFPSVQFGISRSAMTTPVASFARRQNHDASIDSICTTCYQTIASGETEAGLEAAENGHGCDPNGEYCLSHPGSGHVPNANSHHKSKR